MSDRAISLKEAARRIGLSYSHARHKVMEGTFPVAALRRQGRSWWKFSERDIEAYLASATEDAEKGARS